MRRAIELAQDGIDKNQGGPFGCVVVKDGQIIGEGCNRVTSTNDPSAHAEIVAMREACRNLNTFQLDGCELYTSCEPCAMCVAAMELAGIARLYYAASLAQSERALGGLPLEQRFTVDITRLRDQAGLPVEARAMPAEQRMDDEAVEVLQAWAAARPS